MHYTEIYTQILNHTHNGGGRVDGNRGRCGRSRAAGSSGRENTGSLVANVAVHARFYDVTRAAVVRTGAGDRAAATASTEVTYIAAADGFHGILNSYKTVRAG